MSDHKKKKGKPANAIMGKHTNDWCHFCGHRVEHLADVWYSENAEHRREIGRLNSKYVRICAECGERVARIARGEEKDARLHWAAENVGDEA